MKSLNKQFLLIGSIVLLIFVMVGILWGKSYYDTYHDRPLASGLQYVGRNYNSPCYLGTCYGPTTEIYYYATDIKPDDVVKQFPGWKIDKVDKGDEKLWNQDTSYTEGYNLTNPSSGTQAFYEYIADNNKVISASHLIKTNKKYIILIPREDYDILRKSK